MIVDFLSDLQAISKIYLIAQKGKKDLEEEYVSNVFSDVNNPSNTSSYISIRNILENRLNHQIQQYNMNMNKGNTTMSMPVSELHGHVNTHKELSLNNVTVSHKAQHGYIAASLHDAYIIILNRPDWWDDRSYMKFFFNEDDPGKRNLRLIGRTPRLTLSEIESNIAKILIYFEDISIAKNNPPAALPLEDDEALKGNGLGNGSSIVNDFSDKLMITPFGRQYGKKIDGIINEIFNSKNIENAALHEEAQIAEMASSLMQIYKTMPGSMTLDRTRDMLINTVYYLLAQDYGLKLFTEKFFYDDRRIPFSRFYHENKDQIEDFVTHLFMVFFEETFSSLFRIVRSLDMKQYACAFIIKRIYLTQGETLPVFGYFLIKSIARYGKIKVL